METELKSEIELNLTGSYDGILQEMTEKATKEGIEQRTNETKKTIAIFLLSRNMEISEISKITNLSVDVIEQLKNTVLFK